MGVRGPVLLLAAILAGCASAPVKPPEIGPRLRIAVVEFENKTSYGARLGSAAADILMTELVRTDRFILVERAKLSKLLEEQKLGLSGVIEPETAARMGRLLGAAAIITGAVSEFGVRTGGSDLLIVESKKQTAEAAVDARIVDVETGAILHAESGRGEAASSSGTFLGLGSSAGYDEALEGKALRAAIQGLARSLSEHLAALPWSCRVAEVEGGDIYLDAGVKAGLNVGQALEVIRRGEAVKSPDSGLIIGYKETRIGEARVEKHFGEDGAIARMSEGGAPKQGDICRLPKR